MTTKLTTAFKFQIIKRFYPRVTAREIVRYVYVRDILPNQHAVIPTEKSLVLFNRDIAEVIVKYKDHHNTYLAAAYHWHHQTLLDKSKSNKILFETNREKFEIASKYVIEKAINQIRDKELNRKEEIIALIKHKLIMKEKLSDIFLDEILSFKNIKLDLDDFKMLFDYFDMNPPTKTQADLFFYLYREISNDFWLFNKPNKAEIFENTEKIKTVKQKTPLEIQVNIEKKKIELLMTEINNLRLFCGNDINKIITSDLINKWSLFIRDRSVTLLPLTVEEKELGTYFENIKQKVLLEETTNKLVVEPVLQKKNSLENLITLPVDVRNKVLSKHFLPEDYVKDIELIKKQLHLLSENNSLNDSDIKFLSLSSSATVLDEEGNVKLTQKAYELIRTQDKYFEVPFLNQVPDKETVLNKLKDKQFDIVEDYDQNLPGDILPSATLLHKTLVIQYLDDSGKSILLRLGMFTSAQDDNTIMLSKTQEINSNFEKRNKEQRFRLFSHFIKVGTDEPVRINIKATLFAKGFNAEGEMVLDKLINEFQLKEDLWCMNAIQLPFHITSDVLNKITKIFLEKKLLELEKQYNSLMQNLDSMSLKERKDLLKIIENNKNEAIIQKEQQRVFASLPMNLKKLVISCDGFKDIVKKDIKNQIKKQDKEIRNENATKFRATKEKESMTNQKSAKEIREEYLKQKNDTKSYNE